MMEKYENISVVGEGSYGIVMKCRHKETGQIVAIKKFIETEEDQNVRKMALREIRMLKKLHHENLVNMIEVFRRKRRFYLVFEYMDHTVLDELEEHPGGLGEEKTRKHIFQVIRGIDFCHNHNIIHRDVKPENILVSQQGVIKLCDFGFARLLSAVAETYTDYVATRWYRAPELLVGDTRYGREVDIWAIGCLFAEMMSGDPLFPGESDIDQLFQITRVLGRLCGRHQQLASKNPLLKGIKRSSSTDLIEEPSNTLRSLYKLFPSWPNMCLDFVALCLRLDPVQRPTSGQLLEHPYFTHDNFAEDFLPELKVKVEQEFQGNPLLNKNLSLMPTVETNTEKKVGLTQVPRRSNALDPPRWKINLVPDIGNSYTGGTLDRAKSVIETYSNISLQNKKLPPTECSSPMEVVDDGDTTVENNNNNTKFGSLNKYSPLLSSVKLNTVTTNNNMNNNNNTMLPMNKPVGDIQSNSLISVTVKTPPSHSPFQSLQSHHNITDHTSLVNVHSTTGFLHPSVNTINITQTSGLRGLNENMKRTIGPPRLGPGVGVMPPRTQLVRRLDRGLVIDPESPQTTHLMLSKPAWKHKPSHDDFSLPNLPGAASTSPSKGTTKKKLNPVNPHVNTDTFISPRINSRSPSVSPPSRFMPNLPFV